MPIIELFSSLLPRNRQRKLVHAKHVSTSTPPATGITTTDFEPTAKSLEATIAELRHAIDEQVTHTNILSAAFAKRIEPTVSSAIVTTYPSNVLNVRVTIPSQDEIMSVLRTREGESPEPDSILNVQLRLRYELARQTRTGATAGSSTDLDHESFIQNVITSLRLMRGNTQHANWVLDRQHFSNAQFLAAYQRDGGIHPNVFDINFPYRANINTDVGLTDIGITAQDTLEFYIDTNATTGEAKVRVLFDSVALTLNATNAP